MKLTQHIFNFPEHQDDLFFQQVLKNVFPPKLTQEIIPIMRQKHLFYYRYSQDYRIMDDFFCLDFSQFNEYASLSQLEK